MNYLGTWVCLIVLVNCLGAWVWLIVLVDSLPNSLLIVWALSFSVEPWRLVLALSQAEPITHPSHHLSKNSVYHKLLCLFLNHAYYTVVPMCSALWTGLSAQARTFNFPLGEKRLGVFQPFFLKQRFLVFIKLSLGFSHEKRPATASCLERQIRLMVLDSLLMHYSRASALQ